MHDVTGTIPKVVCRCGWTAEAAGAADGRREHRLHVGLVHIAAIRAQRGWTRKEPR